MSCVKQGNLVYGRPPLSEARILMWEQWVDDWFDTSVGFKGDTQQRYRTIALWVLQRLFWLRDPNY